MEQRANADSASKLSMSIQVRMKMRCPFVLSEAQSRNDDVCLFCMNNGIATSKTGCEKRGIRHSYGKKEFDKHRYKLSGSRKCIETIFGES